MTETVAETRRPASYLKPTVFALFFASGVSALIYEIVWTRQLRLVFGDTVFAVTTVLAAFMAGLALGSALFGRIIDARRRAALTVYAILEIGIGVYALILPFLLQGLTPLCIWIVAHYRPTSYTMGLIRFGICFLVLLPATTLMGGTLPVLTKHFVRRRAGVGTNVGALYAINTLGAVVGCLLPSFILIAAIGVRATTYLAVAVNVLAGLAVLVLDRITRDEEPEAEEPAPSPEDEAAELPESCPKRVLVALPWLFAVSGFTALAYEILWTRMLVYMVGVDTQAFSTMLAVFLSGLTIGSFVYTKFLSHRADGIVLFIILELVIGLSAMLSVPFFRAFSLLPREVVYDFATASWSRTLLVRFARSIIVMIIPTLAMGAIFPLVTRLYIRGLRELGARVGKLYALNTVGGIFGSIVSGFVLVPLFGIQRSIVLLALINVAIAVVVIVLSPALWRQTGVRRAGAILVPLLIIALVVAARLFGEPIVLENVPDRNQYILHYYEEGRSTSIAVLEDKRTGVRELNINGMSIAFADYWDFKVQKMLAHLPILLHKDPRRVLMIAFGSGSSSGAAMRHGLETDGVELEEAQRNTAQFFEYVNYKVLDDPKFHLNFDDGRNWLLTRGRKYDVISRDTLPPKRSQDLFSVEFYELCKEQLNPGGVVCAFLPTDVCFNEWHFKRIMATFKQVFPHASLWYVGPEFLVLVATEDRLDIDYLDLKRRMAVPRIRDDLAIIHLQDPLALLSSFLMAEESLKEYVAGATLITDDNPIGFVNASEALPRDQAMRISEGILRHRGTVLPFLRNLGPSEEEAQRVRAELARYFDASEHVIRGRLHQRHKTPASLQRAREEHQRAMVEHAGFADAKFNYSLACAELAERLLRFGDVNQAIRLLKDAVRHAPDHASHYVALGAAHEQRGDKGDRAHALAAYGKAQEIRARKGYPSIVFAQERLDQLAAP